MKRRALIMGIALAPVAIPGCLGTATAAGLYRIVDGDPASSTEFSEFVVNTIESVSNGSGVSHSELAQDYKESFYQSGRPELGQIKKGTS